jgi:hypothetical protein
LVRNKPQPNPDKPEVSRETRLLAWAGWQLQVPANWHPVKMEGTFIKGSMFIGDDVSPYLMLRWWRPLLEGQKEFDIDSWLESRFKKLHALPQPYPPAPAGLDRTAWVEGLQTKKQKSRTIWYGYQASAEIVIEVLMTSLTPPDIQTTIITELIPSLKLSPKGDPIPWSLFTTSFISPPGFILDAHHLYSGDVALRLVNGRESLILRMVYPAGLALSRRKLSDWLDESPFLERRKNRDLLQQDWRCGRNQLKGVVRTGRKRLPFPLGFVRPQYNTTIAAVDEQLDRLMVADHRSPDPKDLAITARAVEHMNWDTGS